MVKIKGKSLVGLDIGSKYLKAVEIAPTDDGFALLGYAQREIPAGEDLKVVLKDFFHTAGFTNKKVVTSLSGRSVIVRYITMPEMSDEELKNAIKFEASKYIPFEAEEVMLDCQRMNYEAKGVAEGGAPPTAKEMRVVLVAAKRNLIDDSLTALEGAGLWPFIIDLDVFALGNAFELHSLMAENKGQGEGAKSIALVEIGASKTSLNIMYNNNSYFTREITIAGNDFTEALSKKMGLDVVQAEALKCEPRDKLEEVKEATSSLVDDLLHEIQLSFDYFEHQFEKPIDSIYLSGGSSYLVGLDEALEKDLQKKPVRWNPLTHIEMASDKINQEELNRHISQLVVAIGLASRLRKA